MTAAVDSRVKVAILMSGGSAVILPNTDSKPAVQTAQQKVVELRNALIDAYPVLRHDRALTRFAPRPLLLMNGKSDEVAIPQKIETLYKLAGEPKQLRWYNSGHSLPAKAYRDAADWLQNNWAKKAQP